jgi:hypothetical protein
MYNLQRKIYGPKEGLYGRSRKSLSCCNDKWTTFAVARKLFAAAFLRCRTRVQSRGNFGCCRILESLWRKSESCSASLMHQVFGSFGEEFLKHVPVQEEAPGGGLSISLTLPYFGGIL